jgi:hypothetical protein
MLITDFGYMEEAREWREKIEAEDKQAEKPPNTPDFQ